MKKFIFLCLILIPTNVYSLDINKLISVDDLIILFDQNKRDWNENVLFLVKKKSFSKLNHNSGTFYLKSINKDGEIITMPIFSNNNVKKIKFEYIFLNNNDENLSILKKHFNSINGFCSELSPQDNSILVEISKCD